MITKRNKQPNDEVEIYRLNEQTIIQLHNSEHIVSSLRKIIKATRLLCVIEINNKICWHTIGLSNFIQQNGYEIVAA